MANEMKTLAKETAIYGLSSILGKFLNWCLVPLYTYVLTSSADYGVVETVAHFTAARHFLPNVDFIIDIGGQDMK
jgi:O-antigen/teichoic acid export membrane protein